MENPKNLFDLILEQQEASETEGARDYCVYCFQALAESDIYERYRVCPHCRFHYSLPARERINLLADPKTFDEKFGSLISLDPLAFTEGGPYPERLSSEQKRTGLTEAAVTGVCKIGGLQTVLAVLDFGFLGGTMGSVVGEKVALSFELAIDKKLPMVAVLTSGGTRLQEGVLSLMQMAKTTAVARRMQERRLPFVAVLGNPTTGQVYTSFANLADLILAEPGSLIGFAPLRLVERNTARPLATASHTAEAHLDHGMLDMVVDRTELKDQLSLLLDMLSEEHKYSKEKKAKPPKLKPRPGASAWKTVLTARHAERPTATDYIARIFTPFVEIHGDRLYGDDRAVVCGLASLRGRPVMVVAQERGRGEGASARHQGRIQPEGFRKAQRAMQVAAKFELPVVCLVDTPGPDSSLEAEERGLGHAIANTMATMSELPTRVLTAVIGEGGAEGAMAFAVADRIVMLENAILEPISPERAALLLYRDPEKAQEMASSLKLTARDCKELGIVDVIVPEPEDGAHTDHDEAARRLAAALAKELEDLEGTSVKRLLKRRFTKYRNIGEYSTRFRRAVRKETRQLRRAVVRGVKGIGKIRKLRGRLRRRKKQQDGSQPPKGKEKK